MDYFKCLVAIIWLYFGLYFASCHGEDPKKKSRSSFRGRKFDFLQLKNRIIKGLAHIKKYDVHGWVNINNLTPDSIKTFELKIEDGQVICMSGNNAVPVKEVHQKIYFQDDNYIYGECKFKYIGVENEDGMMNVLPVMRKKESKKKFANEFKLLPKNFEGYLVCEKEGEAASLVPYKTESLEFVPHAWRTLVDIHVYKNPLARYGRQYKITILDNVKILKNGKKSFFWPIPAQSMVDVYDFQKAIDDSKKGKFCMLSRDEETFDIHLDCHSWKINVANSIVNGAFLAGYIIMNAAYGSYFPFVKHDPILVKKIALRDGDVYFLYNGVKGAEDSKGTGNTGATLKKEDNKNKKPKGIEEYDPYTEKDNNLKKSVLLYSNLAYLLTWGLVNGAWSIAKLIRINSVLNRAENELRNAELAFSWKLQYSEKEIKEKQPKKKQKNM